MSDAWESWNEDRKPEATQPQIEFWTGIHKVTQWVVLSLVVTLLWLVVLSLSCSARCSKGQLEQFSINPFNGCICISRDENFLMYPVNELNYSDKGPIWRAGGRDQSPDEWDQLIKSYNQCDEELERWKDGTNRQPK